MKQYITQSQFEELTDQQRLRYLTWISDKLGVVADTDILVLIYKEKLAPPGRSIGEIIWFLDEHGKNWKGFKIERDMEEDNEDVLVKVGWTVNVAYGEVSKDGHELIDVLWEAVKAVLT